MSTTDVTMYARPMREGDGQGPAEDWRAARFRCERDAMEQLAAPVEPMRGPWLVRVAFDGAWEARSEEKRAKHPPRAKAYVVREGRVVRLPAPLPRLARPSLRPDGPDILRAWETTGNPEAMLLWAQANLSGARQWRGVFALAGWCVREHEAKTALLSVLGRFEARRARYPEWDADALRRDIMQAFNDVVPGFLGMRGSDGAILASMLASCSGQWSSLGRCFASMWASASGAWSVAFDRMLAEVVREALTVDDVAADLESQWVLAGEPQAYNAASVTATITRARSPREIDDMAKITVDGVDVTESVLGSMRQSADGTWTATVEATRTGSRPAVDTFAVSDATPPAPRNRAERRQNAKPRR